MKNIFLFGAGASYGCKGTNFTVPIGKKLFPLLKKRFPDTWGRLPKNLNAKFSDNFEAGMEIIWGKYSTTIPELMKDLAILFADANINNHQENLYFKIFEKTKARNLIQDIIFSTLNYDCLLEIAAHRAGLRIKYFNNPDNDSVAIWKLHGSCNFVVKDIKAERDNVTYTKFATFHGTGIDAIQPNQVRGYCYGDTAFYPAMSIYMKDKPLQIAACTIQGLQRAWQKEIEKTENIIIVGVYPNLEDKHIWDHISSSKAKIFYCGGENEFKKWQQEKNRHDIYLGKYFDDTIAQILLLI